MGRRTTGSSDCAGSTREDCANPGPPGTTRLLHNELLSQGANAASAALVAFILLLLVGTQILNWQWLLLIPAAAAAPASIRARSACPRLIGWRRSWTTAWSSPTRFPRRSIFSHECAAAARRRKCAARSASAPTDLRESRGCAAGDSVHHAARHLLMAALVLVASSLFRVALRLEPPPGSEPPLASMLQQHSAGSNPGRQAEQRDRKQPAATIPAGRYRRAAEDPRPERPSDSRTQQDPTRRCRRPAESDKTGSGDPKAAAMPKQAGREARRPTATSRTRRPKNAPDDQQRSDGRRAAAARPASRTGQVRQQAGFQQFRREFQPDEQGQGCRAESALAHEAAAGPTGRQQQQSATRPEEQQGKGQQNGGKQQNGKDGQQQKRTAGRCAGRPDRREAQNAQDRRARAPARATRSRPANSPAAASAARTATRDIKQAEQLAAMGKISEILGKRSANITGEAQWKCRTPASSCTRPTCSAARSTRRAARRSTATKSRWRCRPTWSSIRAGAQAGAVRRAQSRTPARTTPKKKYVGLPTYSQTRLGTPRSRSFTRS